MTRSPSSRKDKGKKMSLSAAKNSKRPAKKPSSALKREQISFLEKFAILGELLGTVAHEMNTPISTAVTGIQNIAHAHTGLLNLHLSEASALNEKDASRFRKILEKAIKRTSSEEPVPLESLRTQAQAVARDLGVEGNPLGEDLSRWLVRVRVVDEVANVRALIKRCGVGRVSSVIGNWARLIVNTRSIHMAVRRLVELVNSLQIYTHPGSRAPEPVDINQEIEQALSLVRGKVKRVSSVRKRFGKIPRVLCYNNELLQVWTNLILNACDAVTGGGEIEIETLPASGMVCVRIIDTGVGIPEENLERILEPLFTTKEEGKGTGLGLWIAKQIVQRHCGEIRVESQPGRTVFEVLLPTV